jgi:hypothetical protein
VPPYSDRAALVHPAVAAWRQIQAEHGDIAAPEIIKTEQEPVIEDAPSTTPLVTQVLTIPSVANALKFGSRPPSARPIRRKDESAADVQFSL